MRGLRLEQQIYSIVAASPSTPHAEEAGLPEGVTNYGQLGMASDAPRFERAAYNADATSPQRLHPSRIFYPRQIYSPAVRAWAGTPTPGFRLLSPAGAWPGVSQAMTGSSACPALRPSCPTWLHPWSSLAAAQELDPYKEAEAAHDFDAVAPPPFNPDEVNRLADYKNAPMLAAFLSGAQLIGVRVGCRINLSLEVRMFAEGLAWVVHPGDPRPGWPLHTLLRHARHMHTLRMPPLAVATGKLPRRASTGLRAKLHRRYCRQVKIARIMGVLSPTERWEPPYKASGPRWRPGGGPR